ncbi:MAG: hypothetical protein IJE83_00455, partial [Oscillospiraceae bacterium]|nr:hypothetical protein [Oscillospiraceae bacterium]
LTVPQNKATRRVSLPRGEGGFSAKGRKDGRGINKQPEGQPPSDEGGVTAGDVEREILSRQIQSVMESFFFAATKKVRFLQRTFVFYSSAISSL